MKHIRKSFNFDVWRIATTLAFSSNLWGKEGKSTKWDLLTVRLIKSKDYWMITVVFLPLMVCVGYKY
jgi:hypothetical protein